MLANKTVTIFIDESGKPEVYSAKGVNLVESKQATKYLILAAIRTEDQLKLSQDVAEFKLSLLKDNTLTKIFSSSYTLDAFHAQIDYPEVKKRFYKFINTLSIKIDIIVVEKLKCYPALKEKPGRMYGVMAGQLIKNITHQVPKVEVIFSRKDSKLKLRQELQTEVERVRLGYLSQHPLINANIALSYKHNPHYSHAGLQVADYLAYALFQVYENKNDEWYQIIKGKIGKVWDICNKRYYTRSNPLELST